MLRRLLAVVLLAMAATVTFAQDAMLDRARALIQAKQPKAAFELLAPQEQQRAGDPEFDYLFGVAALDAGQLTRAVFALERVLAVRPDHPQARAEIARAYFLMGENRVARQEFEAVKRAQPPVEVSSTVDRFLDALDSRERARGTGVTGFLEASLGHDDNVGAATATSSFAIPVFPGLIFNLAPAAVKQSDEFWALAGGVAGRYAISDSVGLIGTASFDQRLNFSAGEFDTGSLNASGGVSVRQGTDEFVAAAQLQAYSVDYNRFRNAAGLVGQWRRTIGQNDQITGYVQYARLDYPGQTVRNADRTVLGGAWAHSYGGARAAASFAGLYLGREDERAQNVPYFGHELWGARVGGQIGVTDKWTLAASLAYEERRYGGPDPLFLVERRDRETQVRIAADYALGRNWLVIPALAYTTSNSNIVVSDYRRTIVSVSARYEFR